LLQWGQTLRQYGSRLWFKPAEFRQGAADVSKILIVIFFSFGLIAGHDFIL
jgi:hypothetical protein